MFLKPARLFSTSLSISAKYKIMRAWRASLPPPLLMVRDSLCYFTMWSFIVTLLATLFPYWRLSSMARTMALQSAIGGGYVAFIHPRSIDVTYCRVRLSGITLYVIDMLSHHLPLLYTFSMFPPSPDNHHMHKVIFDQVPFLVYLCFFSLRQQYGLRAIDLGNMILLYAILYFFFM